MRLIEQRINERFGCKYQSKIWVLVIFYFNLEMHRIKIEQMMKFNFTSKLVKVDKSILPLVKNDIESNNSNQDKLFIQTQEKLLSAISSAKARRPVT